MPRKAIDLTGQVFGRLTVLKRVENNSSNEAVWLCNCECGNTHKSTGSHLRFGDVSSCGCLAIETKTKHGKHQSPEYHAWENMLDRCKDKNHKHWKHYGGRGITVCDSWNDFRNFYADMGDRPSNKHSLARIKNELGYFKENCRWATQKEQMRNCRSNNLLTFRGETRCVSEWAEVLGINKFTLSKRINEYGWAIDRALSELPIPRNRTY